MAHFWPCSLAICRSRVRMRRVAGPPYRAMTSGWSADGRTLGPDVVGSDIVVSSRRLEAAAPPGSDECSRSPDSGRSSHRHAAGWQGSVEDFTVPFTVGDVVGDLTVTEVDRAGRVDDQPIVMAGLILGRALFDLGPVGIGP